jgi:hypothetical protein
MMIMLSLGLTVSDSERQCSCHTCMTGQSFVCLAGSAEDCELCSKCTG